jgi:hypothetical protein
MFELRFLRLPKNVNATSAIAGTVLAENDPAVGQLC